MIKKIIQFNNYIKPEKWYSTFQKQKKINNDNHAQILLFNWMRDDGIFQQVDKIKKLFNETIIDKSPHNLKDTEKIFAIYSFLRKDRDYIFEPESNPLSHTLHRFFETNTKLGNCVNITFLTHLLADEWGIEHRLLHEEDHMLMQLKPSNKIVHLTHGRKKIFTRYFNIGQNLILRRSIFSNFPYIFRILPIQSFEQDKELIAYMLMLKSKYSQNSTLAELTNLSNIGVLLNPKFKSMAFPGYITEYKKLHSWRSTYFIKNKIKSWIPKINFN